MKHIMKHSDSCCCDSCQRSGKTVKQKENYKHKFPYSCQPRTYQIPVNGAVFKYDGGDTIKEDVVNLFSDKVVDAFKNEIDRLEAEHTKMLEALEDALRYIHSPKSFNKDGLAEIWEALLTEIKEQSND